ncbi:MAG: hypothetical protein GY865_19235 [candidate division Zixibacteria bacterium]|nr:hypothetical protein [candidate division Zixibacteria bacterium]
MDLKKYIREMDGKNRVDLTLLAGNVDALKYLIRSMAEPFQNSQIDKIVALEAMGFLFGAGVAFELNAGLVMIRKKDKIPWATKEFWFTDYSHKEKKFEIADDAIKPNEKILIVDDWSETGTQLKAAISLIEEQDGIVTGISCLNIDPQAKNDKILSNYNMYSVIEY